MVSQKNALASQSYSDIVISANESSGIVCVSVRRQSGEATALTRASDTTIGMLTDDAKPAKDVDAIAGVAGDGAWLLIGARTDGRIVMRHAYGSATELWASFFGSLCFATA